MLTSKEELFATAKKHDYKPEILEKVYRLLSVLEQFMAIPYLKDRLVLKGGTALNLFHFDKIPRLSVDIDLNYIGSINRETMLEEKELIKDAVYQILQQNQFEFYRNPGYHAGGKMVWRYSSLLGQKGNLEIDLNYMYRKPLWPYQQKTPLLETDKQYTVPVLDIHELAAGKLSALLSRQASRDIFDAHQLLTKSELDKNKLRLTLVIYLAMTDIDLNKLKEDFLDCDIIDIRNRLLPLMRQTDIPRAMPELKKWANKLISELQTELYSILPSNTEESDFINLIRSKGEIKPELITDNSELAKIISIHPAIKWAAQRHRRK